MLTGKTGGGYEENIIGFILGFHIHCIGRDRDLLDLWTVIDYPLYADRVDGKGPQNTAVKRRLFYSIYAEIGRAIRPGQIDGLHVAAPSKLDFRKELHRQPIDTSDSVNNYQNSN